MKKWVYDGKLLVNIQQYADNSTIGNGDPKDGGLYYALADLLNWSLEGMETGYPDEDYLRRRYGRLSVQELYQLYGAVPVQRDGTEVGSISSMNGGSSITSSPRPRRREKKRRKGLLQKKQLWRSTRRKNTIRKKAI